MVTIIKLCNKVIWQLKRQSPIVNDEVRNRWEDFCWHYQGDAFIIGMWKDIIITDILAKFEKLSEMNRFKTWLETKDGQDVFAEFISKEFGAFEPVAYIDLRKVYIEIGYSADNVCDDVYSLVKAAASDYLFEVD